MFALTKTDILATPLLTECVRIMKCWGMQGEGSLKYIHAIITLVYIFIVAVVAFVNIVTSPLGMNVN